MSADQEIQLPRMPEPVAFIHVRPTDKHETGVITQVMAADFAKQAVRIDRERRKTVIIKDDLLASMAASLMRQYGGSFAQCIGSAYMSADVHNSALLLECFADLFKPYIDQAKAMK